ANGLDHRKRLELFRSIADAVGVAHRRGIIHRDLKPSNIRVDQDGTPHVLDFGLAKVTARQGEECVASSLSVTGMMIGSLPWSAPEQTEANPNLIDTRSDVYALGVILHQMLTGTFPYDVSGGVRQTLENIVHAEPKRLRAVDASIDETIEAIALACLQKQKSRRYQSAWELEQDVQRYLDGEPIAARRDGLWRALKTRTRRYCAALSVGVVLLILTVGYAIGVSALYQSALEAEHAAQRESEKANAINRFLEEMLISADPAVVGGSDLLVRDLLDAAANGLLDSEFDPPLVAASLLSTIGWSYYMLGEYDAAVQTLRRSVDLTIRELGEDSPERFERTGYLLYALMDRASLDEAGELLRASLEDAQRVLGADHPTTLRLIAADGYYHHWRGDLSRSREQYERALAGMRLTEEIDPGIRINTYNNLASALMDLGEYEQALELSRDAVRMYAHHFGETHPRTNIARNNLSLSFQSLGWHDDAQAILKELVVAQTRIYGPDHFVVFEAQLNHISAMESAGQIEEVEPMYLVLIDRARAKFGTDRDLTLRAINNYGQLLLKQQRLDEARPLLEEAATGFEAGFGSDHPRTLTAQVNLAGLLEQIGEIDEAMMILQRIDSVQTTLLGAAHPDVLATRNNMAWNHLRAGRTNDAIQLFREILELLPTSLPTGHWMLGVIEGSLGRALIEAGEFDEAETHLRSAQEILRAALGEDHPSTRRIDDHWAFLAKRQSASPSKN
ncbi:MAG: hypothetical protein EA377_06115, partial [Phycisphaerales bacterium]